MHVIFIHFVKQHQYLYLPLLNDSILTLVFVLLFRLDTVATEWGPVSTCDFTTFVPVSVSIFSIIVGVSTFTIWPTMMSLG